MATAIEKLANIMFNHGLQMEDIDEITKIIGAIKEIGIDSEGLKFVVDLKLTTLKNNALIEVNESTETPIQTVAVHGQNFMNSDETPISNTVAQSKPLVKKTPVKQESPVKKETVIQSFAKVASQAPTQEALRQQAKIKKNNKPKKSALPPRTQDERIWVESSEEYGEYLNDKYRPCNLRHGLNPAMKCKNKRCEFIHFEEEIVCKHAISKENYCPEDCGNIVVTACGKNFENCNNPTCTYRHHPDFVFKPE